MTSANEFLHHLASQGPDFKGSLKLAPGPLVMKVAQDDVIAAKLLLWLADVLPEGATVGDVELAMSAAQWWHQFWSCLDHEAMGEEEGA